MSSGLAHVVSRGFATFMTTLFGTIHRQNGRTKKFARRAMDTRAHKVRLAFLLTNKTFAGTSQVAAVSFPPSTVEFNSSCC